MDAPPTRPQRADVAAAYDRGVDGYVNVWSEVILPPARAAVAALGLSPSATVLDVGAGSGALVPSIRESSPGSTVIALDASAAMLRAALERTNALAAQADAAALPVRGGCADAVVLAFVLFHLGDPVAALGQAARALRPRGQVATVTWAHEKALVAYDVWDRVLSEAGAAPLTGRRVDAGLDSPDAMRATLERAGLRPSRVWTESLARQWTPETYWQLANGSGLNRQRLEALDPETRARTLAHARQRLDSLEPDDFAWTGEVVCAVAARG